MTAIANVLSRTLHLAREIDALEQVTIFCAAGLLLSLVLVNYGVDLGTFAGP